VAHHSYSKALLAFQMSSKCSWQRSAVEVGTRRCWGRWSL